MSAEPSGLPPSEPDRHLALIGMAGTGKSTVGRVLARRCGLPFVDLDRAIEQRRGSQVGDIFGREGEAAFRRYEAEALTEALAGSDRRVVATGGGIVVTEECRRLLKARAHCLWLRCGLDALVERLSASRTARPLLDGDVAANTARLLGERTGWYEELADVVCDVDGRAVDEIVDELAGWVP